jgi:hypothetical protein
VAEELPAASGDVEQTTSAVPRQTAACRSWCKRALGEAVAIIRATAGLVIRLLIYVGGLWRRRRLQHKSSLATLSLGQQALAAAVGDVSICQELGASGAATNSGKPTWQQEQLLQKLGETLVVQPAAPPSVASAWHAARSIRGQSEEGTKDKCPWPGSLAGVRRRLAPCRRVLREFRESFAAREFETQIYGEVCIFARSFPPLSRLRAKKAKTSLFSERVLHTS